MYQTRCVPILLLLTIVSCVSVIIVAATIPVIKLPPSVPPFAMPAPEAAATTADQMSADEPPPFSRVMMGAGEGKGASQWGESL